MFLYHKPEREIDNDQLTKALAAQVGEEAELRLVSAQLVGYSIETQTYQVSIIYEHKATDLRTAVLVTFTTHFLYERLGLS